MNAMKTVRRVQTRGAAAKRPRGKCRRCGCTQERACGLGCAWVNAGQSLCDACERPRWAIGDIVIVESGDAVERPAMVESMEPVVRVWRHVATTKGVRRSKPRGLAWSERIVRRATAAECRGFRAAGRLAT